mmetsp:Transcript_31747/g.84742  ORF Transcript_31747/g.84742 Transcript_31747/m.84742 type:complete len:235 (+) Transcript_31747:671-1375(+)
MDLSASVLSWATARKADVLRRSTSSSEMVGAFLGAICSDDASGTIAGELYSAMIALSLAERLSSTLDSGIGMGMPSNEAMTLFTSSARRSWATAQSVLPEWSFQSGQCKFASTPSRSSSSWPASFRFTSTKACSLSFAFNSRFDFAARCSSVRECNSSSFTCALSRSSSSSSTLLPSTSAHVNRSTSDESIALKRASNAARFSRKRLPAISRRISAMTASVAHTASVICATVAV